MTTTEELKVRITVDTSDVERGVAKAKRSFESLEDSANGSAGATRGTSESMAELKGQMEQIRNFQVFDLLIDQMDTIKEQISGIKNAFAPSVSAFKNAGEELAGAFNFKNFEGDDTFADRMDSMKIQVRESATSIKQSLKTAGQGFTELKNVAVAAMSSTIAKLAALVAVVVGLGAAIKSSFTVSQQAKDIQTFAAQAGMTADAYQKWAFILKNVGASTDDMIGAQQTLLEAQIDVKEGAEDMIAAFQKIGLSQEDVLGMNQQQLFEATVAGLQQIPNATERAHVAYKLLSEDSKTLASLLKLSNQETSSLAANFRLLGGAMSGNLLNVSAQFRASLANLSAAFQGFKNTIAEVLLPIITKVVDALTIAIAAVNMFMRTIFGLDLDTSVETSVGGATSGIGAYTESVDAATGAVEKLKRTTMGFDELNIVSDPNTGGGGSGGGIGSGGGGGAVGSVTGDTSIGEDTLGLGKMKQFFEDYKTQIQDVTTFALIGVGVGVAVMGALTGNIPMVLAGLALAGIGFAIGNVEGGTFDRLQEEFEKMNLEIVPMAMIGIGAVGAVLCALSGNWPGAIIFAAMAGVGLASIGGGDGIKKMAEKYGLDIGGVVAPSMVAIGIVGAALGMLVGNVPFAIASLTVAGMGLGLGALTSGGLDKYVDEYGTQLTRAVGIATGAVGVLGLIACLLTGNIPGAVAFGVLAGVGAISALSAGGDFWPGLVESIKAVWDDLKAWFVSKIKPVFTKAWWEKLFGSIKEAVDSKLAGMTGWFSEKWNAVVSWFNANVKPKFTKQYWVDKFNTIKEGAHQKLGEARTTIINGWNNIKSYFTTNIAPKFTLDYWKKKFETLRSAFQTKLGEVRTQLINSWNAIKAYFNENIAPKFTVTYWKQKFETVRSAASTKFNEVRTTVMNVWNNVKSWFQQNVAPKFTVDFWKKKFNTVKDGAKAAFNGVIGIIETAINSIVKKINTISWKIPDYVPKYGGKKFGFDLKTVKIPRLATGGIVMDSTLANIGEKGAEAVLPLENNTDWMDLLADKIAAKQQGPSKIVLKVGERELGWATIKSINGITRQTGGLQLQL